MFATQCRDARSGAVTAGAPTAGAPLRPTSSTGVGFLRILSTGVTAMFFIYSRMTTAPKMVNVKISPSASERTSY